MMLIGTPEGTAEAQDDWGTAVLQRLVDDYVDPALARRLDAGTWDGSDPVVMLQVLFPRGAEPIVRVNGAIDGDIRAIAAGPIEAGQDICLEDYKGLGSYEPAPADAGTPHVTALRHRDGWDMVFELNYQHPQRFEHHSRGREFAATAREALAAGRVEVALDNAFSAAELLAKAELLSCGPAVDYVLGSRSHAGVATPYSLWARLGNTERRFARLLHRLAELRGQARYVKPSKSPKDGEPEELLGTLADLEEHARRAVEQDYDLPRTFNVIAARPVQAGEFVTPDAFTLRPSPE